jgi:alkanesulfonate monooxygenase SsuD/methylene tetrahydromethanopterin reductase-like flavin-dependent oxidoreductase (luciferase family)
LSGGISAAAIALANSQRLKVGVGVLPAPMRNVAGTAMEIATLARAYPGRVRIGVGHGVQDWMAQIGERVASPMTLLREYVTALSALLHGERVTVEGRYVQLTDVCLDWPPDADTELLVAAQGPRTLALSGELGSGTVITGGTTPEGVREARQHIHSGIAKRSEPRPHSIVVYVVCATEPDAERKVRDELAHWTFDASKDLTAHGTPEEIAASATRWIDAGATTIALQPPGDADIEDFVNVIGRQVMPLLGSRTGTTV